jgi:hypothetical protein
MTALAIISDNDFESLLRKDAFRRSVQSILNSDIDSYFQRYHQKEEFKRFIKDTINTEFFWRDLFGRSELKDKIKSVVNDKINEKMSNIYVTSENIIRDKLPSKIDEQLNNKIPSVTINYLDNKLSKLVADEILKQLPLILNNDPKFQQILNNNQIKIESIFDRKSQNFIKNLEELTEKRLNEITHDDQYHIVNKRYFDAIEDKALHRLNIFEKSHSDKIVEFDNKISEIKVLSSSLQSTATTNLQNLQNQVQPIQNKISKQEDEIKVLKIYNWLLLTAVGSQFILISLLINGNIRIR